MKKEKGKAKEEKRRRNKVLRRMMGKRRKKGRRERERVGWSVLVSRAKSEKL